LISNLQKGIQFIGFLNKAFYVDELREEESKVNPNKAIILLLSKEMKVLGFNKVFVNILNRKLETLKLQKYHEADHEINMLALYPSIFKVENMEYLTSTEGLTISFDFTPIMKKFQEETVDEIDTTAQHFMLSNELKKSNYLQGSFVQ
jgi:hypothetical protein